MEITDFSSLNSNNLQTEFLQTLNNTGVPLPYFIPRTKKNHYFYKNGLSHIIPTLKVKVHSDVEVCYELWEKFSSKKSLYDQWDFRYSWYQGYQYKLYFYTLYEGTNPLVVLPLWYSNDDNRYEWFGGWWMEDNKFFAKEEKLINLLFPLMPTPLWIHAMPFDAMPKEKEFSDIFISDEPKYTKKIKNIKTINEYLQQISKKHRYNLKSDYNKIRSMSPKIKKYEGANDEIFNQMMELNKKRFNGVTSEKSDFFDKETVVAYDNIFKNAGSYKVQFIEVKIKNKIAAIDMIIKCNNNYHTWIGANNVHAFKGIGNFMLYYEIKEAIKNDYDVIDCSQIDYGWKHRYFDEIPLFKYQK